MGQPCICLGLMKDNLQGTKTEHDDQDILLPPGKLQRADNRQRQYDECDVGGEVESSHNIPDGQGVETSTLDRVIPERRDRHANQGQQEGDHDCPCTDKGRADGRDPLHDATGEDPTVLEEDRDLDEAHGDVV